MISEETLQNYFNCHLLATELNAFSATEKSAARFSADLDVAAVLGRSVGDDDDALLIGAVSEQAIHLLMHRSALTRPESTSELSSESIDGVGSRSYHICRRDPERLCERAKAYLDGALTPRLAIQRG